jgi:hypothetical protein
VRNVLEHSASRGGAFVCAQYYKKGEKVALGVADCGIGVRESLSYSHPTPGDLDAIYLALRPGITGTTKKLGGTSDNAGAGLFYTKSLAVLSQSLMVAYSGNGFFKLLKTPRARKKDTVLRIQSNRREDHHRTVEDMPTWPGTVIGVDIAVQPIIKFSEAFEKIGRAFNLDLRERRANAARKQPRFTRLKLVDRTGSFAEDKDVARELRDREILPSLAGSSSPLVLDFSGVELATQSFIHALLSQAIRTHGPAALDRLTFKGCNRDIRTLVTVVSDYSQEAIEEIARETGLR